jgi:hypothetical protein
LAAALPGNGAIKIVGSASTFADAEKACDMMLEHLKGLPLNEASSLRSG